MNKETGINDFVAIYNPITRTWRIWDRLLEQWFIDIGCAYPYERKWEWMAKRKAINKNKIRELRQEKLTWKDLEPKQD